MITVTSFDAQNRFSELINQSKREPIEVTDQGQIVAYVISGYTMRELEDVRKRRLEAAQWYAHYRQQVAKQHLTDAPPLADAEVNTLVHELR